MGAVPVPVPGAARAGGAAPPSPRCRKVVGAGPGRGFPRGERRWEDTGDREEGAEGVCGPPRPRRGQGSCSPPAVKMPRGLRSPPSPRPWGSLRGSLCPLPAAERAPRAAPAAVFGLWGLSGSLCPRPVLGGSGGASPPPRPPIDGAFPTLFPEPGARSAPRKCRDSAAATGGGPGRGVPVPPVGPGWAPCAPAGTGTAAGSPGTGRGAHGAPGRWVQPHGGHRGLAAIPARGIRAAAQRVPPQGWSRGSKRGSFDVAPAAPRLGVPERAPTCSSCDSGAGMRHCRAVTAQRDPPRTFSTCTICIIGSCKPRSHTLKSSPSHSSSLQFALLYFVSISQPLAPNRFLA